MVLTARSTYLFDDFASPSVGKALPQGPEQYLLFLCAQPARSFH